MFAKGDAVWIKSGPAHDPDREHLFCVVTNPSPDGKQLLVNMTGRIEGMTQDPACPLEVGDHPAITKPSFIDYSFARLIDEAEFVRLRDSGEIRMVENWSGEVLERIRGGVITSKGIAMKSRVHYQTHKSL